MNEELTAADHALDPQTFYTHILGKNFSTIRQAALSASLGKLRNRFISWRLFLGVLNETDSAEGWIQTCRALRNEYYIMQESYKKVHVQDLDPLIFNPLSQSIENPWNSFYQDNELKQVIKNDIDRTFQERALFQKEETKEMMISVLFTWSKNNPEISYRQGMNELLAVFFIVAVAERFEKDDGIPEQAARVLQELNDPTQTEADIYWMFTRLMALSIKELFLPVVVSKKKPINNLLSFEKSGYHNELVNSDKTNEASASVILKRCHRIHHRFLQALDKQLYMYIESQKIEPQIYLQRWVRCLLSREFNLSDTLVLWDSIFACAHIAEENRIEFFTGKLDFRKELVMLDFLCIAMIIFVRSFLLQCDATGIMRRLLKFPPVEDVGILISMANSYKERILSGKGVTVPKIVHDMVEDDPLRNSKPEPKVPFIPLPSPKSVKLTDKIDTIISILQEQSVLDNLDTQKMTTAYDLLSALRNDVAKIPRKVR